MALSGLVRDDALSRQWRDDPLTGLTTQSVWPNVYSRHGLISSTGRKSRVLSYLPFPAKKKELGRAILDAPVITKHLNQENWFDAHYFPGKDPFFGDESAIIPLSSGQKATLFDAVA